MHPRGWQDYSTFVAIGCLLLCVGLAIAWSGISALWAFVDLPSFMIVALGTFFITSGCFSFQDFFRSIPIIFRSTTARPETPKQAALAALRLSEIAYQKGFLFLDRYTELIEHNRFLEFGILQVVDGLQGDSLRRNLEDQAYATLEHRSHAIEVLRKAAEIAPAMGLLGTLIGLVQMLSHFEDSSMIGPSMAVALLTTFYGTLIAYGCCFPLASKLERLLGIEALVFQIYTMCLVSIARKENPRQLEVILNGMLPVEGRLRYFDPLPPTA
jgi:chemotaxis protein MotA